MNKKSFLLGALTGLVIGIILTIIAIFLIGYAAQRTEVELEQKDPIEYLEKPTNYENKSESSFQVFQVLGNAALANEESDRFGSEVLYLGNTVLILGENFYNDQIIEIKNPQIIGTYSYTNNGGRPMTVPVIDGRK